MTDEPEYYSIHDQMHDMVIGAEKKIIEKAKINELDDIRQSLKYILDKMSSMDRFLRSSNYRYGGRVFDGEQYESEVIKKFLCGLRDNTATDEQKEMFRNILTEKPKLKEIEEGIF